ncbi:LOW QUALITY PROTEIN: hypothetical protein DH2020_011120 [Rehmannia glutinosa]|uniref:WRKY19-like zinc finger domain-containing protein n=1 Tax=Rehmannia glutinosa TaxID=99300 RepID=A0ABR0XCF8_REHGL
MYSSFCGDLIKKSNFGDTTLRLDGFGYGTREAATFLDSQSNGGDQNTCKNTLDDGCKLVLGLGPTPSAYSDEYSPSRSNKGNIFSQGLSSQRDSILKLGLSGSGDAVSNVLDFSASTQSHFGARRQLDRVSSDGNRFMIPVVDEGSTSAKKSGGYMRSLIMAPRMENAEIFVTSNKVFEHGAKSQCQLSQLSSEPSALSNYSIGAISEPGNATASSNHKDSSTKKCKFAGCTKGARGATGMCIGHGGGQRCQKPGCNNGAESRTAYCKAHGGGRRCEYLGCTKSAEGKTDHCIAHGGGKRCGYPGGCTKAARGRSGLCIRHGGGKRCTVDGCTRSAEGQIGLCISHGGGRRCQFLGCTKGAQGSTVFCKAHGGGKRCIFADARRAPKGVRHSAKARRWKTVLVRRWWDMPEKRTWRCNYCVAHGGERGVPSQDVLSARADARIVALSTEGETVFENCEKSAQGSTDFCKAHGGGKRCNWGEGKCEKFARGKSGLCAAHSSLVHGREMSRTATIGPGLFHGLVKSIDNTCSSSGVSVISDSVRSLEKPAKRQQLIPPQVLVPLSMKASSSYLRPLGSEKEQERSSGVDVGGNGDAGKSFDFVVPEGRVHGGGLMSMLGGNLNNAINGI